jgi:hypothetical protein
VKAAEAAHTIPRAAFPYDDEKGGVMFPALPSKRKAQHWAEQTPQVFGGAKLISAFPPIIQIFTAQESLSGVCIAGPRLARHRAHFLLFPTWSQELADRVDHFAGLAHRYQRDYPRHTLTFLSATDRETHLMRARGCDAVTVSHNIFVNEKIFRPLPEVEPVYDAVYNAQLAVFKRHELASMIDSLALLYYSGVEPSAAAFHALHARAVSLLPRASFLNALTPDGCDRFGKPQVNRILAQARVGLCLSEVEGAMLASMEYLLAGLSVVSTPSLGGRDSFFDKEYCLICDPDPRSVREAVDALVARKVPRDYVRAKTLARVEAARERYIDFVQDLIDRGGGKMRFADRFQYLLNESPGFVHWRWLDEFATFSRRAIRKAARPWSHSRAIES